MNNANNIESTKTENPSLFEKIFLRIFQPIFISLGISGFCGYLVWQLNLYRTAAITVMVVFFFAFKFFYKKCRNDRWDHKRTRSTDYEAGNTNDPRNPSSYGTPGSPYYAYDHFDRQNSRETSSAFSDFDNSHSR